MDGGMDGWMDDRMDELSDIFSYSPLHNLIPVYYLLLIYVVLENYMKLSITGSLVWQQKSLKQISNHHSHSWNDNDVNM